MPRNATWTNDDGLVVGFGTHSVDENVAGVEGGSNGVKRMQMRILGTSIPNSAFADTDVDPQAPRIRRGSIITRATLQATTAWTGTGTLTIGTWGHWASTPAVDDADGIDATVDVDSVLAAVGDIVYCDGALVGGAVSVGETSNSDVVIAPITTGTVSAGEAVLTVEYIEPQFDASLAV